MFTTELEPRRYQLQKLLESTSGLSESDVHFQPPRDTTLRYPCILYSRDGADTEFADNKPHRFTRRYQVTVISSNPDETIGERIARLPLCSLNRNFVADTLNHEVFTLFF